MTVFTLLQMAAQLKAIQHDMHAVGPAIVARGCEMVAAEAKRVLGTYDYGWPPLQPETIARKMMGDTPLLETGALRESIEWSVNAEGTEGFVGSNNPKAVWHEFGTSRIPPRPFLAGAAAAMEEQVHRMAVRAVRAVLAGRGLHSSELGELIHLLRHAGHAVREDIDMLVEGPEEESKRRR